MSDWKNFAQTINLQPVQLEQPETFDELVAAVEGAVNAGKKVRLGSSGHAWSNGVVPGDLKYEPSSYEPGPTAVDAWMIDPTKLSPFGASKDPYLKAHYFEVGGTHYVAIPPGTRQGWLAYDTANYKKEGKDGNLVWYDPNQAAQQSNEHPNLAVGSMGPAPQITLGGFIANGCHGTGWELPTVSDLLMAVEVLCVDGTGKAVPKAYAASQEIADALSSAGQFKSSTITVSEDAMSALRVSLGSMGVITRLVLQLEPLFMVGLLNQYTPVSNIFPSNQDATNLAALIAGSDYLEIFWFPFTDELWIKRLKRHAGPTRNEAKADTGTALMSEMASYAGKITKVLLADAPPITPEYMQFSWDAAKRILSMTELKSFDTDKDLGPGQPVVYAPDAYLYQQKYFSDFLDTSWTVEIPVKGGKPDFTKVMQAWKLAYDLVATMHKEKTSAEWLGKFPLNLNIHMRFIKNSQALLSPANWGNTTSHTCWIEFLSFTPIESKLPIKINNPPKIYREYADRLIPEWAALGGVMHWGKLFQTWSGAFPDAHSKMKARGALGPVNAMRKQNDPKRVLQNNFIDQILGSY